MEFVAKQKNFGNPSRRTSLQILNFQINDEFDRFFNILKNSPETDGIFNLWYEIDSINGRSSAGPDIRKQQFYHYLKERLDLAQYLFVGEAPGYQGGHFTGIPMTSERILLGYKQESGVAPESVFREIAPQRTSKNEIQPKGFTEPTATIVWGAIAANKIDPRKIVLWNMCPWHTFDPGKGYLSNRTPTSSELEVGLPALRELQRLFGEIQIFAVGKSALHMLESQHIGCGELRHPAHGGATKFRRQFREIFTKD